MQRSSALRLSATCACFALGCSAEDPNYDYLAYSTEGTGTSGLQGGPTQASSGVATSMGGAASVAGGGDTASTGLAVSGTASGSVASTATTTNGTTGGLGTTTGGTNTMGGMNTGGMSPFGGTTATDGFNTTGGTNQGAGGTMGGVATTGSVEVPDAPYCEPTANWDPEWTQLEEEILQIVNEVRAAGADCGGETMPPVGPLMMNAELQCAARMHSFDMNERDFFDHDNPDGDGPSERMDEAGYSGRGWGENIAAGRDSAEGTMDQWMNSPGHCRNIMSDNYTLIGVGYHPGGQYGHLWTQTFGG